MNKIRHALALFFVCSLMSAFAQDEIEKPAETEKIAVYVYGANDAGINKSFGNWLLLKIVQNSKYAEVRDWEAFYEELAGNNNDNISQITQAAKQYNADVVCVVSIIEVFGDYSIFARLIKTSDSQIIRTALLGRSLKSLGDLAKVSSELAGQLLQLQPPEPEPPPPSPVAVDEPYVPLPVAVENKDEGSGSEDKKDKNILSLGFRAGFNFSHLYAEYEKVSGSYSSTMGLQLGLVLDIATNSWLHFQTGLMYIQKGVDDYKTITSHYIEIPFLYSVRFSMLRVNAGPYLGICFSENDKIEHSGVTYGTDFGLSVGLGFDIRMFYIGAFYDYGLADMSSFKRKAKSSLYSRTLGFNLGVNL
ncbi:MAG: PorT family protein [Candidatus Fibromonas sp.]|jgi:hypothetical protein|nr:PorT family protein [Candidatus Fibromonas sp.]